MARVFTRIGKQITMAAKSGSDPESNPRLRALIQEAKSENMPKENVERAIKRATEKDKSDYKEIVYEGYAPHGVALIVETTTDNTNRTVANVRSYFSKYGSNLTPTAFLFEHKCVFKLKDKPKLNLEELELELIDFEVDDVFRTDDGEIMIYGPFEAYGSLQKYIEEQGFEIISGGFDRIPNDFKDVTDDERATVEKLIDKIQEDEDVTNVYSNMR